MRQCRADADQDNITLDLCNCFDLTRLGQACRLLVVALGVAVAPVHAQRPANPIPQGGGPALKAPFRYIDVHVHPIPERGVASLTEALAAMDEAGIGKAILLPPPQVSGMRQNWDHEAFAAAARARPERFAFLGGGGSLNPTIQETDAARVDERARGDFAARARRILADGAIGFGEMTAHHLSHAPGHPYESVPADHPLFLVLADIAAEYDVPIDLHLDLVSQAMRLPARFSAPPNPAELQANLEAFERLLAHNRRARVVWAHAGTDQTGSWTPQLSGQLLERHPNLYMSIRLGPSASQPMIGPAGINGEWLAVFERFPDRFVLGGDQFFMSGMRGGPAAQFSRFAPLQRNAQARLLAALPEPLGRKFAYENATRIYRLSD